MISKIKSRREPSQDRSKVRVQTILDTASKLILEDGFANLKVKKIAERAHITMGSIYQYFPDRSDILKHLAEQLFTNIRELIEDEISEIENVESAESAIDNIIDSIYRFFRSEPVYREIWYGIRADRKLSSLDIEDTWENSRLLYDLFHPFISEKNRGDFEEKIFLASYLCNETIILAISMDEEKGNNAVRYYKDLVKMAFASLQK